MFHTKEVSGFTRMKIRVWAKKFSMNIELISFYEEYCKMPVEYWRLFEEQQMTKIES